MDQLSSAPNPELPSPAKSIENGVSPESGSFSPEVSIPAQADRMAQANDAVAQASYGMPAVIPADPASITTPQPATLSPGNNPPAASDLDVMEKVWVQKAKEIVEENRDDPHKQTNALSGFKRDYVFKRFNKELPSEQKT